MVQNGLSVRSYPFGQSSVNRYPSLTCTHPRCSRLFVLLGIAFPLSAQAQPVPPANLATESVVVTATRTAQSSFDIPASIDAIGREALQGGNLQINLSESLVRIPGIVVQNRQNYAQDLQISSRGFGARSTFGVRGIRLFADGIPATMPDGQGQVSHIDLSSAARVEVLRGPFSSLYGNSSGGVIAVFTENGRPGFSLTPHAAFGSYGTSRTGLKADGSQGPLSYVIDATHFETDGYREHSAARRDNLNAKLRWKLSDATTATLIVNGVSMPDVQDPLGLSRAEVNANPRQATLVANQFNTRKSVRQAQGGVTLEHRFNTQHSLTAMVYTGKRDVTQFQAIPVATQAPVTHPGGVIDLDRQYWGSDLRYSFRGSLSGTPFSLHLGVNYDKLDETRRGYQNFIGATLGVQGVLRRNEDNRVFNVDQYAQAEWQPHARLRLQAGVRHSSVKFNSQDNYIVAGNGNDSGSATHRATTPVAGVTFHASDAINLYASAGKGFETPTFNELAYRLGATGLNFDLKPAKSTNLEAGIKARLADSVRVNAALFQARTQNEIAVLSNTGGRSSFQNVGRSKRTGLEIGAEGAWTLGAGELTALTAFTALNARYQDRFLTCTAAPCAAPTVAVAAGKRIPGIPASSFFGEVAWKHTPTGFSVGIEARRSAKVYVDDLNSDTAVAYSIVNLRAGFEQKVGNWQFKETLRIDNLSNRNYIGSVIVNDGNARYFEAAPKRAWLLGLSASYKFN